MALRGVRVVEIAGLAPGPFCGMVLADFGATVTRIDRTPKRAGQVVSPDTLDRGKQSVAVDLKAPDGINVVKKLCSKADVLIEPFRKGVMEKLGLGPDILLQQNPRLIYARLTGFGQKGSLSHKAGHDINYIATSGVLSQLGRKHEKPCPPINLVADFAGGGLMCALGISMALYERTMSGKGQVIDSNMVNGSAYVSTFLWSTRNSIVWSGERGENLLDTGRAFYETYKTKDGKYMSVGALEPQFYADLLKGLGLSLDEMPQFEDPEIMKKRFTEIFLTKTRDEWTEVFANLDACVEPILDHTEAPNHPHNLATNVFLKNGDRIEPAPAPKLSRTPGIESPQPSPKIGQHTVQTLLEHGFTKGDIDKLLETNTVFQNPKQSNL